MKEKILAFLRQLPGELNTVFRHHPIESQLVICVAVGGILTFELDWPNVAPRLVVMAFTAIFAFGVNNFVGEGAWRKLYWVCWMPMIPLLCWGGLEAWFDTWQCAVSAFVLLPLFVLMSSRAVHNERFISTTVIWLRAAVISGLFVNIALGLFCAIIFSVAYIFGLEGNWAEHVCIYALIISQSLAVPVAFMMMADRWRGASCSGNRIVGVLLNYIVTPALLIYAFILYLYIVKIVFTWSLPRGGVAYMIFGFMLAAFVVQALQFLIEKRIYDRFFNRLGWVALPVLVLFWAGVVRRTDEYGLTDMRVLLIVCGGLMTLCALLFVARRTGRYLYMCLAAFLVFGAMAYIPSLEPEQIADRSQFRRALRAAENLDLLAPDGKLVLERVERVDSVQQNDLRRLYQSLDYLEYRDTTAFTRFGIENIRKFRLHIPESVFGYVVPGWFSDRESKDSESIYVMSESRVVDLAGWQQLYTDISEYRNSYPVCQFRNDTLRVGLNAERPEFIISGEELLQHQLRKLNVADTVPGGILEDRAEELLTYTDEQMMILFSSMQLERRDSTFRINNLTVEAVLTR